MAGYTFLEKTEAQTERFEREFMYTPEDYEENIKYFNKITDLCADRGIQLEFFIVPACEYVSSELSDELRNIRRDTTVTNFNDYFDEIGLDLENDFFDKRHVNFKGATKFSDYLSEYIEDNYELSGKEHDADLWQRRIEKINEKLS